MRHLNDVDVIDMNTVCHAADVSQNLKTYVPSMYAVTYIASDVYSLPACLLRLFSMKCPLSLFNLSSIR